MLKLMTRTQAFDIFRTPASRLALPAAPATITNRNHERHLSPFVLIHPERPVAPSPPRKDRHLLKTKQTSHRTPASVGEYQIISEDTELLRGSRVAVLLGVPFKSGDLIMFRVGSHTGIGRWHPNVGGFDWILQPGRLSACVGEVPVQVVGPVIPCPPLDVCVTGQIKASPGSSN